MMAGLWGGNSARQAKLKSISQRAGEKVVPYLNRIKVAAAKVEFMRFGTCSMETHPNLTLEECKRGANDEPATELRWPCAKGAGWAALVHQFLNGATIKEQGGILADEHKACPPCCKKVEDFEWREWLIKKQFLMNMYDKEMRQQLNLALLNSWISRGRDTEQFEAMKNNMADIIFFAELIEDPFRKIK